MKERIKAGIFAALLAAAVWLLPVHNGFDLVCRVSAAVAVVAWVVVAIMP